MDSQSAKRITVVGPLPPYRGGIAHFTEATMRGLGRRGHEARGVTFIRQYPELLFPGTTQYEIRPMHKLVRAPRLIDTVNPLSWRRTARRIVDENEAEVVVFQHWMPFIAPAYGVMARLLRRKGVRVLAVVHNALPHERRPGDVPLTRFFLRACHGAVALSDAVADDVERLAPGVPVRRCKHPVYDIFGEGLPKAEARAQLDLPDDAEVLLFFGFIRRYKGLHVLLDALPEVVRRRPNVRLVVAGEFYEDEAPYRAQIEAHGLGDHVRLASSYISSEHVGRYFSAADVVVQPYVSATQSGVVQIAYHFGRPVVVTDVGGLAEVVPHGVAGLVVPPEDPAALAEVLVRFFAEGLGPSLAEGAARQREHYSWDRLYEALEALI